MKIVDKTTQNNQVLLSTLSLGDCFLDDPNSGGRRPFMKTGRTSAVDLADGSTFFFKPDVIVVRITATLTYTLWA